jgi:N-acetylneuraminic acid mutarotase
VLPTLRHQARAAQRLLPTVAAVCLVSGTAAAQTLPALPFPVSNAAVASGSIDGEAWVFAVLGMDTTRRWSGITRRAVAWNASSGVWRSLPDVPGPVGRLAATAQVVRGRLFVFGGYTVDSSGREKTLATVDAYDPRFNEWTRAAEMPVAVDDAVSVVYRDSLVYLISGWHDTSNVRLVQMYDVWRDAWYMATPINWLGVFGHTGAITGNTIVYIDGAIPQDSATKYRIEPQVWVGTIDRKQPHLITWRAGMPHPGPPLYRAAAGRCGPLVIFAGGTDNAYNYNGIGYNGVPSAPSAQVLAFDTRRGTWQPLPVLSLPSMDHRAMAMVGDTGWLLGGMQAGQRVSDAAVSIPLKECRR